MSPSEDIKLIFLFFLLESTQPKKDGFHVACLLSHSCSVVSVSMVNNTDVPDWTHKELRNTKHEQAWSSRQQETLVRCERRLAVSVISHILYIQYYSNNPHIITQLASHKTHTCTTGIKFAAVMVFRPPVTPENCHWYRPRPALLDIFTHTHTHTPTCHHLTLIM